MPNAKVLSEKQAIVAALTEKVQNAAAGVIVDYKGITVAEDTALRAKCRENDIEYTVIKNTLLRFAFNNCGLNELDDQLNGTTSLAICASDPVAPARAASWKARSFPWKPSMLWLPSPRCLSCRLRCLAPCWRPSLLWPASSSRSPRSRARPPRLPLKKLPPSKHPPTLNKNIILTTGGYYNV